MRKTAEGSSDWGPLECQDSLAIVGAWGKRWAGTLDVTTLFPQDLIPSCPAQDPGAAPDAAPLQAQSSPDFGVSYLETTSQAFFCFFKQHMYILFTVFLALF